MEKTTLALIYFDATSRASLQNHYFTEHELEILPRNEVLASSSPPVLTKTVFQVLNGVVDVSRPPVWLHMDLMSDNILAEEEEARPTALEAEDSPSDCASAHGRNGTSVSEEGHTMLPRYILDYGDIIHGERQMEWRTFFNTRRLISSDYLIDLID